jgi:protein SCO1/2
MKRALAAALAGVVVVVAVGLGVVGYLNFGAAADSVMPKIGGPFTLEDGAGHTVTDAQFRGRLMLIYFGYTHCPDACPTALNTMAVALGKLGEARQQVQPIFITVDPERDGGKDLDDYAAAFGADFIGLTGKPDEVVQVKREFRVYAAKHPTDDNGGYDMDHSSIIYLMDGAGRYAAVFTDASTPADIAAKLSELIGAGKGQG